MEAVAKGLDVKNVANKISSVRLDVNSEETKLNGLINIHLMKVKNSLCLHEMPNVSSTIS